MNTPTHYFFYSQLFYGGVFMNSLREATQRIEELEEALIGIQELVRDVIEPDEEEEPE